MAGKFYAVKEGRNIGIFESWIDCKKQVDGYSGAKYKSFKSRKEAMEYLDSTKGKGACANDADEITAYVDGSYNIATNEFSYGVVILKENEVITKFNGRMDDKNLASMRNVAGEIKGAEAAMKYALENGYKSIAIYHDYEGIARWCLGEWKANKDGTKAYKVYFDSIKNYINIRFVKVKGHSNDRYNDMADILAKEALGLN